jgi:hypothetical protein
MLPLLSIIMMLKIDSLFTLAYSLTPGSKMLPLLSIIMMLKINSLSTGVSSESGNSADEGRHSKKL